MIKDYLKSRYLRRRYQTLIEYINAYYPQLSCELEGNLLPAVRYGGYIFKGFPNSSGDLVVYKNIRKSLPQDMRPEFYRIVRDLITRYIFPHMIPQLKPLNGNVKSMNGFHGQHKDSLQDIQEPYLRDRLIDVFSFKHDDVIVDCGAYIGFGDMRVSQRIPHGKVIAIEAKKECFEILTENITMNKISNVQPLRKAVWNKNETIKLNTGELQSNSLIFKASQFGQDQKNDDWQTVEAITVDSLVDTMNLPKIDFMSLTLNGAEVEAIEGMKEVLSNFAPRIRLAGWYQRNHIPIWKHCSDKLKQFDYQVVVGSHGSLYAFK